MPMRLLRSRHASLLQNTYFAIDSTLLTVSAEALNWPTDYFVWQSTIGASGACGLLPLAIRNGAIDLSGWCQHRGFYVSVS